VRAVLSTFISAS